MGSNVISFQAFTELPSIAELQNLLIEPSATAGDFFLHETNTLFFPVEEIEIEKPEAYRKYYYLDYSHKRKKGKFKKYK